MKKTTLIGSTIILMTAIHAQADIQTVEDKTLSTISGQSGSLDNVLPAIGSAAHTTVQLPGKLVKFYIRLQLAPFIKIAKISKNIINK